MPSLEVRNRLRMAHEHAAASLQRAATVHEEAAAFWDHVGEETRAAEHWGLVKRCVDLAKEHRELADRYTVDPEFDRDPR